MNKESFQRLKFQLMSRFTILRRRMVTGAQSPEFQGTSSPTVRWLRRAAAIPCLALMCVLAWQSYRATNVTDRALLDRYQKEARDLLERQRFAEAAMCYERLAMLGADSTEVRYGLALAAQGIGDRRRTLALMSQLAPRTEPGYAPAHLWHAQRILASGTREKGDLFTAEAHLTRALHLEPNLQGVHWALATVYFRGGEEVKYERHLRLAAREQPAYNLPLALHLVQAAARLPANQRAKASELRRQAAEIASRAITHFANKLSDYPERDDYRLRLAQCHMVNGSYQQAVEILDEGIRLRPVKLLAGQLAQVYLAWAKSLKGGTTEYRRLELILRGHQYDPSNPKLIKAMLAFTDQEGEAGVRAREKLAEMLASGKTPDTLHIMLGVKAWAEDRKNEAIHHLEQALTIGGVGAAVAMNNLAFYLVESSDRREDHEKAHALIERALKRFPKVFELRDTRARVYLKLGRWHDALRDFEYASRRVKDPVGLHRGMALAYEKLGMRIEAEAHRQLAAKLDESKHKKKD